MVNKDVMKHVVDKYGKDAQSTICMEECAELIQAISKAMRYKDDPGEVEHLAEEIADVLICIEQLKIMYNITDNMIREWIYYKEKRQVKRMEG